MKNKLQRQHIPGAKIPEAYRVKWPVALLNEGFVPFPKVVIRGAAKVLVGPGAMEELMLLLAIIDFKRPSQTRDPSIEYLAFTIGFTVVETTEILSRLIDKELVATAEGDRGFKINTDGFFAKIARASLSDIGPVDVSTDEFSTDEFSSPF